MRWLSIHGAAVVLSLAAPIPPAEGEVTAAAGAGSGRALLATESGGALTVHRLHRAALLSPPPALELDPVLAQQRRRGEAFFNTLFVPAPDAAGLRDGLGPFFNAAACDSCHNAAHRGRPPSPDGEGSVALVVQSSVIDAQGAARPHPRYGRSITAGAIPGVTPEGRLAIRRERIQGLYPDAEEWQVDKPAYRIEEPGYGVLDEHAVLSVRIAQSLAGMGLIDAIPEALILAAADPEDSDGDGISGRPNVLVDGDGRPAIGRFGWKANEASLEAQIAAAFVDEMGITSGLRAAVDCTAAQVACAGAPDGGAPELARADFAAVVAFLRLLPVPVRRLPVAGESRARIEAGAGLFLQLGCAGCHAPTFVTAKDASPAVLAGQVIHPFSDFLLHDMGPGLADGRPDGSASGSEWRTAPLWGLGLDLALGLEASWLHDGRARSLEAAILWHDGEAAPSRKAFESLSSEQRRALQGFLESL